MTSTTHTAHSPSQTAAATAPQRTLLGLLGSAALWGVALPAMAQAALPPADMPVASAASSSATSPTLQLSVGRQHMLAPAMALGRIAVGDPNVLDVKVLRSTAAGIARSPELLLTPKAPGSTSLVIWPPKGLPQTMLIQVSGPRLLLERRLATVPEHALALADLRLNAPAKTDVMDRSQIAVKSNTVQVEVQVVEFKKSALRRAGINLSSGGANNQGFSFGLQSPGGTGTSNSGESSAISSAMNLVLGFGKAFSGAGLSAQMGFLESNGLARVLAKPTLVAHTGQSASFLAGGEIPIPVPSGDGNVSIEYKEFGIKLQLTPTILSDDRIALKVSPEASDLDFSGGITISGVSVPALRMRRADTMVELADGESFIIGGLVSRTTTSSVNKVPLLGDLPILGAFFKNMQYSQEETELAIVVTPHLVHPLPAQTDLQALLPGADSERRNSNGVWGSFVAGALDTQSAVPGFSY